MTHPNLNQVCKATISCFLLVVLMWNNVAFCCYYILNADCELIELVVGEEKSSEEEQQEDKFDKIFEITIDGKIGGSQSVIAHLQYNTNLISHYLEIHTPPPEYNS